MDNKKVKVLITAQAHLDESNLKDYSNSQVSATFKASWTVEVEAELSEEHDQEITYSLAIIKNAQQWLRETFVGKNLEIKSVVVYK